MRKKLLSLSLLLFVVGYMTAQVTTVPVFVDKGYDGQIVVNFNPNEGNRGMASATQCYAHTGLITADSKNDGDWKNTVSKWRGGEAKFKMTKVGEVWQLVIPNIYTFYNCATTTDIRKLAFVFNDGPNGSLEGKTANNTDIMVELVEAGTLLSTIHPTGNKIIGLGEQLSLTGYSTIEADLSFSINGEVVKSGHGTQLDLLRAFSTTGLYEVVFTAVAGGKTATSQIRLTVVRSSNEAKRPADLQTGITYIDSATVALCLYAGSKTEPAQNVFVVGDFNDWTVSPDYQMYRDGFYFWITIDGLEPGKEYAFQYKVIRADGCIKNISDPYSEKLLHPDDKYEPIKVDPTLMPYPTNSEADGYVTVINTRPEQFQWSDATLNFKRPDKNNLVIYELWIYDFTPSRSIAGLMDMLDYLQTLGVNAIELMPICEFDGNYNWGYSPNHYFAPDKAYGSKHDYKVLIDECHKRGMAVIVDMVFNHGTGLNPQNKLYPYGADLKNNPYFNVSAPHSDNVYEDWNHDFPLTREMFTRSLNYWIQEFHVDGYRMDLSHGFCGENCNSMMDNISHYYYNGVLAAEDYSQKGEPYFILEHWGDKASEQWPTLINKGMMCWKNINNAYSQLAMGWLSSDAIVDANRKGYVTYCESHDEERNFYKVKTYGNGSVLTYYASEGLSRIPITRAFNILLQGPKMMFQYEELGYDYSINSTQGSKTISENNRTSKKEQPIALGWLNDATRMHAYNKVAQIIQLRTKIRPDIFEKGTIGNAKLSSGAVKYFTWTLDNDKITVVGNFNVQQPKTPASNYSPVQSVKPFTETGQWFDYITGEKIMVGSTDMSIDLAPGDFRIFTNFPVEKTIDAINTAQEHTAHVYPTITDGLIRIDMPDMQSVDVALYNMQGQKCSDYRNVRNINISNVPAGVYMLRVITAQGVDDIRIIKH